ncbi:uncharacterized protein LOC100121214 [Nasonia vitripennis]|uniref:DUF4789 domain-containing protein n=1 Tax=Nasonia vitripennis TaxID=7425 RepID=A0A7M7G5X3_NASVI|nr:uncharacterized protein LOC100121214 [Nasonia vitripennis]
MKFPILLMSALMTLALAQDIVFPNDDDSNAYVSGGEPITERKPVKVQDQCPENMLLYPDDGPKSTWVCDCKPRFVYFPKTDSCHEAFLQGPCPLHHYVYLAPNDTIPRCVNNPCSSEGLVHFGGLCHQLRTPGGPCGNDRVLGVNETTFQLECIPVDLVPFVIIEAPKRSCPKGSRRNNLGICKLVL